MLYGRADEIAALKSVLESAGTGRGGAVVVRGEAGIGKSSLIRAVAEDADGFRVLRCVGVESETSWSFSGLQMLLADVFDHLDALPRARAEVLRGVLGLAPARGNADTVFHVGLSVLDLLAQVAATGPVLCVVDDAHWVDRDSAEAMLFAARRIVAEPVAMIFAARDGFAPDFPAPGLPELRVGALDDTAARSVLATRFSGGPDRVGGRILDAAAGNPLALLSLPLEEPETRLGADLGGHSMVTRLHQVFTERIERLPPVTRTLLLVAAADDTGSGDAVIAAAGKLGAELADLEPAEADSLVGFADGRFEFGHPLVRSAAYHGAPSHRRVAAHRALAEAVGPGDRSHVRHLAAATVGPDESVAAALEAAADRESSVGGHSGEAVALSRAAALSPEPADRARRLVRAAEAAQLAGHCSAAVEFAVDAERLTADHALLARALTVRARVATWTADATAAHRLWLAAADHTRDTGADAAWPLFCAVESAWFGGEIDLAEEVAERAERLGVDHAADVRDLVRAAAGLNCGGASAADAVEALHRLIARRNGCFDRDSLLGRNMIAWWHLLAGDFEAAGRLADDLIAECREAGAAGPLVRSLAHSAQSQFARGRYGAAAAAAAAVLDLSREIGHLGLPPAMLARVLAPVAAVRGDEDRCGELVAEATALRPRQSAVSPDAALALLDFGLGRHEAALHRLERLSEGPAPMDALSLAPTFVEAAVKCGEPARAESALAWFTSWAEAGRSPVWLAVLERCRGLTAEDSEASEHYERAAELHGRGDAAPFEAARTDLVYGEWLRRSRRIGEARKRFRTARDTFERLGAVPWVERTRAELRAAGAADQVESGPGLADRLTAQELHIVKLAAAGLTNREIGDQLYLSPRTVGYHLYKAYPKLGVASRKELGRLRL